MRRISVSTLTVFLTFSTTVSSFAFVHQDLNRKILNPCAARLSPRLRTLPASSEAPTTPAKPSPLEAVRTAFYNAGARFKASPREHILIPIVASLVGWFTNWLAVEMIFFPLTWWGIPIKRWPDNPFGLIGWQGIVPTKAVEMSGRIVDMVTTKVSALLLLELSAAFNTPKCTAVASLSMCRRCFSSWTPPWWQTCSRPKST